MLGAHMAVQACIEKARRYRYATFASICLLITSIDFLFTDLGYLTYETLRVVLWGANAAAILWLFHMGGALALGVLFGLPAAGFLVWHFVRPELATTLVVPASFAIAAVAHGAQYAKNRGFGSCVLCACSVVIALMCSLYFEVLSTEDPRIIGLGYLHYASISLLAVLFGWVNIPREMRGKAPVKVAPVHALIFGTVLVVAEMGIQITLLVHFTWPPVAYLGLSLTQVAAILALYFHHRHQLVIFTDNVTELLENRTESLRIAQDELAKQNEIQADKLRAQASELETKGAVIERQRRLELAAQTAGQAAHDIQNLISPMLVHIRELQLGAGSASIRRNADQLKAQIDDLLDLNGQMLALSRRGRLEYEPLGLEEVVDEIRRRFPAGAVDVRCQGQDLWVSGSWSQLLRAISNLVANALESKPGAQVVVRAGRSTYSETRRCHLGFLAPGEYCYVEIADNGPGIPPELVERIFEPFFTSKRGSASSGSGLGLTIVSAVVDDHRGVLDLSTGTSGTTFTIFLQSAQPSALLNPDELCGNETVAVIDDDIEVRRWASEILTSAGYAVVTAASRFEFLRLLQSEPVSLIILDYAMPGGTGYDTFFGAMHIRPGIKAVMHSAHIPQSEINRLRALGVRIFLDKPCSKNELLQATRSLLDEIATPQRRARSC